MKTAQNNTGGFDIAVLTYETTGEALSVKASPISETVKKERLLIISDNSFNAYTVINEEKRARASNKPKRTKNRKRETYSDTLTYKGKAYKINNGSGKKKLGVYIEIMQSIIHEYEIASNNWKRVFILRFDLRMDIVTKDSKIITDFRKRLVQKLKREYGFDQIGYCWVREHEKAKQQHYHFVLFLDGNIIRHSSRINKIVKATWERPTGGYSVWHVKYYLIDNEAAEQEAIYHISYLAKTRGKGYRTDQAKDFGRSRLKVLPMD